MSDTKRRLLGVLAVVAVALPFAACGDDAMAPPPQLDNPSLVLVRNNLLGPVLFFFARSCGTTGWGGDLLSNHPVDGTIQPGAEKEFTVEAGCYDFFAQHLENTDPGGQELIDKMIFGENLSPVATFVWNLDEGEPS